MLGRTHALSGSVLWLAASPTLAHLTHGTLDGPSLALGAVVCAGAALLPDLDDSGGTLSHALGPVSDLLTKAVAKLSGGHRHATHSLTFAAASGVGTWALVAYVSRWAMLALVLALVAAALRATDLIATAGWPRCWVTAAAIIALAGWRLPGPWSWLPWAVVLGCLAHLAGDLLTPRGIRLLWPLGWRVEAPLVDITTGTWRETRVIAPVLGLAMLWLGWIRL